MRMVMVHMKDSLSTQDLHSYVMAEINKWTQTAPRKLSKFNYHRLFDKTEQSMGLRLIAD